MDGERKPIRALDLFCGCGGLSTGLAAAGWEIVAGVDHLQEELATFNAAHPAALGLCLDLIGGSGAARQTPDREGERHEAD